MADLVNTHIQPLDELASIPWGHIRLLIDKCENNPRDMGQLITYVSAVDGIMKKEGDQPTVGLLLCKNKDNILAKYATNAAKVPVSISDYQISHLLEEDYRRTLPTIEELERELRST